MNKTFTLLFLCILGPMIFAQLAEKGSPKSWELNASPQFEKKVFTVFDNSTLLQNDDSESTPEKTLKFAEPIEVEMNLNNAGSWLELENGDRLWRLGIKSQGALSLNLIFDSFSMPDGGYVQIYSHDRSDLVGAYDKNSIQGTEVLGTWPVKGDDIVIEYYEPKSVRGQGKLQIGKVFHAFRDVFNKQQNRALNSSGHCNHDVDCTVGNGWDPIKDDLKHSAAFIVMGGFVCSGSLINNTAQDGTPYFLTANHCSGGGTPESAWTFRFNWISPNPICANFGINSTSAVNHTINGAQRMVAFQTSDVRLLRLNTAPPSSWGLTWSGWDRTDTPPSETMGIHHPAGDIMKVARDDNAPSALASSGVVWRVNGGTQGGWELGVTEGGSSGSPLYSKAGRIIGQLWRGAAACSGTNDNGQQDEYGRFAFSWNNANLGQWLDPMNTGATTQDLLTQAQLTLSTEESELSREKLEVYLNPSSNNHELRLDKSPKVIAIYASSGKLVSRITKFELENKVQLKTAKLPSGKYFVTVEYQDGKKAQSEFMKF